MRMQHWAACDKIDPNWETRPTDRPTDLSDAEAADEVDYAGGESGPEHEIAGGPVAQLGRVVHGNLLGGERGNLWDGRSDWAWVGLVVD